MVLPPSDFSSRKLPVFVVRGGTILHRCFHLKHDPVHFDQSDNGRFNAPDGSYGVMYLAVQRRGAFAETFLRSPGSRMLDASMIDARGFAEFQLQRTLRLATMMRSGLARMGATAEVPHGPLPYSGPQAWSSAIERHPDALDGIAYFSRHDDGALCCALFQRARPALREIRRTERLTECGWFWKLMDRYDVGLAP